MRVSTEGRFPLLGPLLNAVMKSVNVKVRGQQLDWCYL